MDPSSPPPLHDDPRAEPADWISIGEVVAERYRIERMLGEGGMGVVYAARHVVIDRDVAVKFLAPALADDAVVVERFLLEARASGRLRHKHIVEVLDCGADRDRFFLVMEFLHGETLQELIDREGPLSPQTALGLFLPVLDALAFVHARGFLHRDIKPDNIFLAREGDTITPKILDFGITRCVDDSRVRLTLPGGTLGTPAYMAPEQALGRKDLTGAVDQFSAAVVLYEMLSGTLPQRLVSNLAEAIATRATQPMIPLEQARAGLPAGLVEAVMRALSLDPRARFASIEAFRDAVAPFASEPRPSPPPPPVIEALPPPPSARRAVGLVVGVSVVVCALVVGGGLFLRSSDPSRVEPRTPRVPTPAPDRADATAPLAHTPPADAGTDADTDTHETPTAEPDAESAQPAAPVRHHGGRHRRHRESADETPTQDTSDLRSR
jgi:serine/threonine-protein kinase